jgi:aryl-alcohol dehydrogenase-like predicted oxidoreductase
MEMRCLGRSGLRVSALSFGTMTFGGEGFFSKMGQTQTDDARRLVGLCLDSGVNLFDTADVYSNGASESILGQALGSRREEALIATKVFARMGGGPNDAGLSRHHIIEGCEASLRRLGTDYIDLYQSHSFDAMTPLEETLSAFDSLIRAGKVRYIGCSNYSGWHLMKALAISERDGFERFVSQQIYYSLAARDAEHELVPLALDQGVGILVWSPLAFGLLSGKFRRGQPRPAGSRLSEMDLMGLADEERAYSIVDVLDQVARSRGVSIAQAALNYLLRKPGVTSVIVGARNEQQLRDNLAAATWQLTDDEVHRLDEISATPVPYPYWHQQRFASERNPALTPAKVAGA